MLQCNSFLFVVLTVKTGLLTKNLVLNNVLVTLIEPENETSAFQVGSIKSSSCALMNAATIFFNISETYVCLL